MDWFKIGLVVVRRWQIFLPVLVFMLLLSMQIRATGAEFVASAEIVLASKPSRSRLMRMILIV